MLQLPFCFPNNPVSNLLLNALTININIVLISFTWYLMLCIAGSMVWKLQKGKGTCPYQHYACNMVPVDINTVFIMNMIPVNPTVPVIIELSMLCYIVPVHINTTPVIWYLSISLFIILYLWCGTCLHQYCICDMEPVHVNTVPIMNDTCPYQLYLWCSTCPYQYCTHYEYDTCPYQLYPWFGTCPYLYRTCSMVSVRINVHTAPVIWYLSISVLYLW